ncbi:MAG TPA: carboxypeptidase-like regulatory domain-containing protein, partial [Candidatus Angelobacter sp.]
MRAHIGFLTFVARLSIAGLLAVEPLSAQPPTPRSSNQVTPPAVENNPAATANPQAAPMPGTFDATTVFGEIMGTVKSGTTPLPGVTVSAANTLTGKKYVTSTDVDGSFKISVGGKGRYVVRAELSVFAPTTQEVLINAENRSARADLSMLLQSRVLEQEQKQQAQQMGNGATRGGPQQLSLSGADLGGDTGPVNTDATALAGAGLPNAGLAAEGGTESVAVSGAMGRNEMPTFDPGEMQDRIAEMRNQIGKGNGGGVQIMNFGGSGGDFGGGPMVFMMAGGGPGGLGGGDGGKGIRGFNVNQPHGAIFYGFNGSPLDAKPFSLNGNPEEKASYGLNRFGATLGGPFNIPHIYNGGARTFIFANYTGTHGNNPYDVFSTVPTQAQRSGDFSGSPVQLMDPITHTPFTNNQLTSI